MENMFYCLNNNKGCVSVSKEIVVEKLIINISNCTLWKKENKTLTLVGPSSEWRRQRLKKDGRQFETLVFCFFFFSTTILISSFKFLFKNLKLYTCTGEQLISCRINLYLWQWPGTWHLICQEGQPFSEDLQQAWQPSWHLPGVKGGCEVL